MVLNKFSAATIAILLAGCYGEDPLPRGDANLSVLSEYEGATYQSPAATGEGIKTAYWAHEIATPFERRSKTTAPAGYHSVNVSSRCDVPRPRQQAKIVHVEIHGGYDTVPMVFLTRNGLTRYARPSKRAVANRVYDQVIKNNNGIVDLYLTDTSRPIYLVLAANDPTVWAFHMAEGVQVDGVAAISHAPQGIANLPDGGRIGFVEFHNEKQSECAVTPKRRVDETWTALQTISQTGHDASAFKKVIRDAREDYADYRRWVRAKVGEPESVITAYRTSHVLVGPMPDTPIPYGPLGDAFVIHSTSAIPVWGSEREISEAAKEQIDANPDQFAAPDQPNQVRLN